MLYSDFATPTLSTTADTQATTANLTYNGVGGKVYFVWACGGAHTDTAAKAIMPYALFTGTGVPGIVPNVPLGRWRSAELIGASVGSVSADPTAFPFDWNAPANGVVTIDARNAGSSTAPDILVGIIYGSGNFSQFEYALADPWATRGVAKTCITSILADNHGTTETSIGAMTIPADYPNVLGLGTFVATNGVRVTAESLIGTVRYTATGAGQGVQFEPAQKWPFFGQQMAPAGTDIQEESFNPSQNFHPISFKASANSTITGLGTLKNALTNAVRWQTFAALA